MKLPSCGNTSEVTAAATHALVGGLELAMLYFLGTRRAVLIRPVVRTLYVAMVLFHAKSTIDHLDRAFRDA